MPSVEHASVHFAHDFNTILDVGASRGQFALFARHRFPNAKLICFEPLPSSRESLKRVLGGTATVVAAAVGPTRGSAQLQVSAQDDSSSLLPIGARQVKEFPGTARERVLEVPVTTLDSEATDDWVSPILLKIDVQGFELGVLQGADSILDRIDEVFVECSFLELYEGQALAGEVIALLVSKGFVLRDVHGLSRANDGSALQADLLFQR